MRTDRLKAFSDGVIAILITILVLDLQAPRGAGLSLFPFATSWMGRNHFAMWPTVVYGVVLLCAGIAYYVLQSVILAEQGPGSPLHVALGRDLKGKASPLIYATAIGMAFVNRWIAVALYVVVTLMWLVPDRRLVRIDEPTGR